MVKKDIEIINSASNIALCTLWSKKEEVIKKLGEFSKYINIIGTLYTSYGVNYMLQTLGEYNGVDTLILYGNDKSTSGKTVVEVFTNVGNLLFSKEEIEEIISNVKVVDMRKEYKKRDVESLKKILKMLYSPSRPKRKKIHLKIREHQVDSFPVPVSGFNIFDTSIFRAWIKILNQILTFGFEKPSEYKEPQLEVLNLSATIGAFGKKIEIEKEFFEFIKKEEFERHVKDLLSSEKPEDIEYTYGYRLFSHEIAGNQIKRMIEYLSKKPYSRRCISIVVDPRRDFNSEYPPCIGIIQGIISGDFYNHTVYLRSNDMFRGWPVNMYGQIKLAEYIVSKINELSGTDYKLGNVTTFSFSAHIYQHDWENARKITENYKEKLHEFVKDPKGNFIIYHKNGYVVIEMRSEDNLITRFETEKFHEAYNFLKSLNIMPEHMLYLGKEIQKAFEKLKKGEEYEQDRA